MSLREIPFEKRIELLKKQYIYDVTKTSIQFTEEGKTKCSKNLKRKISQKSFVRIRNYSFAFNIREN